MAARLIASTSKSTCTACLSQRRHATTYASRLGVMLQGTRTPKAALTSRKGRQPLPSNVAPNPQYLQMLRPGPGSHTKRRRAGRSHASRMNRRGVKGQVHKTSRTYIGGGTPILSKAIPRRVLMPKEPGLEMAELHVDRLAYFVRQGRIDPGQPVTLKELTDSRCCIPKAGGIRLYGTPSAHFLDPQRQFPTLRIVVTKASPKAIRTVESVGGTLVTRYHSKLGTRAASRPDRFLHQGRIIPRLADPISKRDLEYYSDPANRGYIWLLQQNKKDLGTSTTRLPVVEDLAPAPGPSGLENPPERRTEEA